MSATKQLQVLNPKSPMDRRLAHIARDVVWDNSPQMFRRLVELADYWFAKVNDPESSMALRIEASKRFEAIAEFFGARTVPTLQSVKGVIQHIGDPNQPQVDWARLRQEAIGHIQAKQSEGGNGNGDRRIH